MIEAELKARVKDLEAVRTWLRARAEEEEATYHDTYYDWPDHRLDTEGQEIRLRIIETPTETTHLLTYKRPSVDRESGSKPEYETVLSDPVPVEATFGALGLSVLISLTKNCSNYRFMYDNWTIQATLVTVSEIEGTFIEIETLVDQPRLALALEVLRRIANEIGVGDLVEHGKYTDAVMYARKSDLRKRLDG